MKALLKDTNSPRYSIANLKTFLVVLEAKGIRLHDAEIEVYCQIKKQAVITTVVVDGKHKITLKGVNWGYSGEGPRGLQTVLVELHINVRHPEEWCGTKEYYIAKFSDYTSLVEYNPTVSLEVPRRDDLGQFI